MIMARDSIPIIMHNNGDFGESIAVSIYGLFALTELRFFPVISLKKIKPLKKAKFLSDLINLNGLKIFGLNQIIRQEKITFRFKMIL